MDQNQNQNQSPSPLNPNKRMLANGKVSIARNNLLLVIVFTVINIILTACNSGSYFLFSAFIPYFCAYIGAVIYHYPEKMATEIGTEITPEIATVCLVIGIVIAVLLLVSYLLCWIFSKRHYGWMIAALVLFSLDSIWLLINFDLYYIMDILFHTYVIYYLIMGVQNGIRVKKAEAEGDTGYIDTAAPELRFNPDGTLATPPVEAVETFETFEVPAAESETEVPAPEQDLPEDSPILRSAYETGGEKVKVFIETVWSGHTLLYRRVDKETEELVVDGQVYAEMPRPRTKTASMSATVAGMHIEAGVSNGDSILLVNGKIVASIVRRM